MDGIGSPILVRSRLCYTLAYAGSLAIAALMIVGCGIVLVRPTMMYPTKGGLPSSLPADLVNLLGIPGC